MYSYHEFYLAAWRHGFNSGWPFRVISRGYGHGFTCHLEVSP